MVLLPRPHAPPRHTVDEAMDGELSTVGGARRENGNTTTPVWDFFLGTAIGSVNDLLALGHGIGYAEMMPYVEAYHPELVGEIESTPAPQLACPDSNIGQLGCDAAPATVGAVTGVVGGARAVGARIFTRGAARGIAPQIAKIEKQLAQHGRASVEKSLRSLERRLAEHRQALETYRAQGGFTSSVEREIRAFEAEIQAIKEVLGRGP